MSKSDSPSKPYGAAVTAARKAGGNNVQSHLLSRLKAVMKRRPKAAGAKLGRARRGGGEVLLRTDGTGGRGPT